MRVNKYKDAATCLGGCFFMSRTGYIDFAQKAGNKNKEASMRTPLIILNGQLLYYHLLA